MAAIPLLSQPQAQQKGEVGPSRLPPMRVEAPGRLFPLPRPRLWELADPLSFPDQTLILPGSKLGEVLQLAFLLFCLPAVEAISTWPRVERDWGDLELGGVGRGSEDRQAKGFKRQPQARGTGRALAGRPLRGLGNWALEARVASGAFASSKGLWKGVHPHGQLQAPYPYPHGREALLLPGMQQGLF